MAAYSHKGPPLESDLTITAPNPASTSGHPWGTWRTRYPVGTHTNYGPQQHGPPPSERTTDSSPLQPVEFNQCVFIRYYTVRSRMWGFPKVLQEDADNVKPRTEVENQSKSLGGTEPHHPTPEASSLPHDYSYEQAWQQLIRSTIPQDELPSLIKAIFSDSKTTEMVKRLQGSDAQAFIDTIDQVRHHVLRFRG